MITLENPWLLAFAAVIPLALWHRRSRRAPALAFAAVAIAGRLPKSWRVRLLALPQLLFAAGLGLVVVALARPVERVQLPLAARGIDIMLCLDVSSSMGSKDMGSARTRLAVARDAAKRFVAGRPADRIGLVRFARYPDLLCPLTLDHKALARFLDGVERVEAYGPEDQTGIGTAVARAAQVLRPSLAASKVTILLTDGEENVGTAEAPDEIGPGRAARFCTASDVRVYTIAAGSGERNRELRGLATTTGGEFFEARDARALHDVYARIDTLEKADFEEPRYELLDRFESFLVAALAFLIVAILLDTTLFGVLP